jgi:hypothetical protein
MNIHTQLKHWDKNVTTTLLAPIADVEAEYVTRQVNRALRVPFAMNFTERKLLQDMSPRRFIFEAEEVHDNPHPIPAALNYIGYTLAMEDLRTKFTDVDVRGHVERPIEFIDIGAKLSRAINTDGCHSCLLLHGPGSSQRDHKRVRQVCHSKPGNDLTAPLLNMIDNRHIMRAAGDHGRSVCVHGMNNCGVRSRFALCIDAIYDITPDQIYRFMASHDTYEIIAFAHFPRELEWPQYAKLRAYTKSEAYYTFIDQGTHSIMSFNDTSFAYRHNTKLWQFWSRATKINGQNFDILIEHDYAFETYRRMRFIRVQHTDEAAPIMVIPVAKLSSYVEFPNLYEWYCQDMIVDQNDLSYFLVPKNVYTKAVQFCMRAKQLDKSAVATYIGAYINRIELGDVTIISEWPVDPLEFQQFILSMFLFAMARRHLTSTVIASVVSYIEDTSPHSTIWSRFIERIDRVAHAIKGVFVNPKKPLSTSIYGFEHHCFTDRVHNGEYYVVRPPIVPGVAPCPIDGVINRLRDYHNGFTFEVPDLAPPPIDISFARDMSMLSWDVTSGHCYPWDAILTNDALVSFTDDLNLSAFFSIVGEPSRHIPGTPRIVVTPPSPPPLSFPTLSPHPLNIPLPSLTPPSTTCVSPLTSIPVVNAPLPAFSARLAPVLTTQASSVHSSAHSLVPITQPSTLTSIPVASAPLPAFSARLNVAACPNVKTCSSLPITHGDPNCAYERCPRDFFKRMPAHHNMHHLANSKTNSQFTNFYDLHQLSPSRDHELSLKDKRWFEERVSALADHCCHVGNNAAQKLREILVAYSWHPRRVCSLGHAPGAAAEMLSTDFGATVDGYGLEPSTTYYRKFFRRETITDVRTIPTLEQYDLLYSDIGDRSAFEDTFTSVFQLSQTQRKAINIIKCFTPAPNAPHTALSQLLTLVCSNYAFVDVYKPPSSYSYNHEFYLLFHTPQQRTAISSADVQHFKRDIWLLEAKRRFAVEMLLSFQPIPVGADAPPYTLAEHTITPTTAEVVAFRVAMRASQPIGGRVAEGVKVAMRTEIAPHPFKVLTGPPGMGKTLDLSRRIRDRNNLVVVPTDALKQDLLNKMKTGIIPQCRVSTFHTAFLQTRITALFIDEISSYHVAYPDALCTALRLPTAYLYGDSCQVPYIDFTRRDTHSRLLAHVLPNVNSHTQRCPHDITMFLRHNGYPNITTSSSITSSIAMVNGDRNDAVRLANALDAKLIPFNRQTAADLSIHASASTAHSMQGHTIPRTVLYIDEAAINDRLFSHRIEHLRVMTSRHTDTMLVVGDLSGLKKFFFEGTDNMANAELFGDMAHDLMRTKDATANQLTNQK